MANERELLERIQLLEQENSALRDKLDMIYAIVAPDEEEEAQEFVQITGGN